MKVTIDHCASAVIIYSRDDPGKVLLEQKDDTHPDPDARLGLNVIGGNYDGEEAVSDKSPLETLIRELKEELAVPDPSAAELLDNLVVMIIGNLVPFGSFMIFAPPGSGTHSEPALFSLWQVGLDNTWWTVLENFQNEYGDIIDDFSSSVIVTPQDVLSGEMRLIFGHTPRLKGFWLSHGVEEAKGLTSNDGYESIYVGQPPDTYEEALSWTNILVRPG